MKPHNNDLSQELLEAIERYINGTMDLKECKDFDDYLKIDSNFRAQVEDVKIILNGIETQALKEELDILHQDIEIEKSKKDNYKKIEFVKLSKIAASIAIILAIGSIWFFSSSPNQKIYNQYFIPDPGLPSLKSRTDMLNFYNTMENYKRGHYQKAINEWQILNKAQPENDTINYFLGLAHMANETVADAIPHLERVVQSKKPFPLINKAHLYLGLAYLKEGNIELAKKHLASSKTKTSKNILAEINN